MSTTNRLPASDATQVAATIQCGTQTFQITNGLIAAYRDLTGVASDKDALQLLGGHTLSKPSPRQVKLGGVVSARHHGLTPDGDDVMAATATCQCGESFTTGNKGLIARVVHMGECRLAYLNGKVFENRMRALLDAHVVEVRS